MTDVRNIQIGQTGLYQWDRRLPVVELEPVRAIAWGPKYGRLFRTVRVANGNSKISFIVSEAA